MRINDEHRWSNGEDRGDGLKSERKEDFRKQVVALQLRGFSRREIGRRLEISTSTVQRILGQETVSEPRFPWCDGEYLTRSQILIRLRRIANEQHWLRPANAFEAWQNTILDYLSDPDGDQADRIGYLLATGPARPGRKLAKDRGILRNEELSRREIVFSALSKRTNDGEFIDFASNLPNGSRTLGNMEHDTAITKKPRNPPWTTPLPCPCCGRMTLYRQSRCDVASLVGESREEHIIGYTSKRCRAQACG